MDEATERNVFALKGFLEENRQLIRELEKKVKHLEGIILTMDGLFKQQQSQLGLLLQRVLGGGPTGGD